MPAQVAIPVNDACRAARSQALPLTSVPPNERTDDSIPVVTESEGPRPPAKPNRKPARAAVENDPMTGNGAGSSKRQEVATRVKAIKQRFTQSEIKRALKTREPLVPHIVPKLAEALAATRRSYLGVSLTSLFGPIISLPPP